MKKNRSFQLFKRLITLLFIVGYLYTLYFLFGNIDYIVKLKEETSIEEEKEEAYVAIPTKSMEEVIVTEDTIKIDDVPATWLSVAAQPWKLQGLDRNLDNFIDGENIGCFLAVFSSLEYDIDIDQFYIDYWDFEEAAPETELQGHFKPAVINYRFNQYLDMNQIDLQCEDISVFTEHYLYDIIKQGWPVIVWYSPDYIRQTDAYNQWMYTKAYIVAGYDDKNIILADYQGNEQTVSINQLITHWTNAFVIGKYK